MKSLSLYLHIPFCSRACPYCTFYHVPIARDLERAFVERAIEEMSTELAAIANRRSGDTCGGSALISLHTLYAGGGTPSLLSEASLRALYEALESLTRNEAIEECTIEANPEDVTGERVDSFARLGFDRVSLGVQSMNGRAQRELGRCDPRRNHAALAAVGSRFENMSVDLLLGIPGGTVDDVVSSAETLLHYEPKHFSVYCLEGGGDAPDPAREFLSRVDQETAAAEYLALCELLENRGYLHYEVSNFALPGFESRHNLAYWEGGDYLGIGPGAHSFIDGVRWHNRPSLEVYLGDAGGGFEGVRIIEEPGEHERNLERLFLGLRTSRGVPIESIAGEEDTIEALSANGLARLHDGRLILTDRGYLLLDEIVLRLAGKGPG